MILIPASFGSEEVDLHETWSAAARAAAAAGRKARGQGTGFRKFQAKTAFDRAGGRRTATKTLANSLAARGYKVEIRRGSAFSSPGVSGHKKIGSRELRVNFGATPGGRMKKGWENATRTKSNIIGTAHADNLPGFKAKYPRYSLLQKVRGHKYSKK